MAIVCKSRSVAAGSSRIRSAAVGQCRTAAHRADGLCPIFRRGKDRRMSISK